MSAVSIEPSITGWTGVAPHPRAGRRAHLSLVPDTASSAPLGALRLTRFGRLLRTVLVLAVAVAVAVSLLGSSADAGGLPVPVTVAPGQTLSHIAVAYLPELPVAEGVAQLQLANRLPSEQIHAGQVLFVPAMAR